MGLIDTLFVVMGATVLVVTVGRLFMVPWGVLFEVRWRRKRRERGQSVTAGTIFEEPPLVSIVVPAYNESVVIANCVRSIARSDYERYEAICVDDGSTDDTYARMQELSKELSRVRAITRPNGGKGAALNAGIAEARGSVVMLVDADGVFGPDTISGMLRSFDDERIGAVCGNDRPVNLNRVQTRFLSLISHLGTGLMRRAMDQLHCLPIVSGNIGAFRRDVLDLTGPLDEHTVGEDLELTWRVHQAGYRIAFAPHSLVYAESPSTVSGLWKQRVRWARGLLQTTGMHLKLIGNPRYGTFGPYLAFNTFTQLVIPVLQILALIALAVLAAIGDWSRVPTTFWVIVLFFGLPLAVILLLLAVAVDGAWGDLRFAWTLPLWPGYSVLMSCAMLWGMWLELSKAENRWNKLERTGVVSVAVDEGPGSRAGPGSIPRTSTR
jgi:cellulose synthase/poly-beta-1,6-N-acetylglucosamine synthase-like glycosyltransferase